MTTYFSTYKRQIHTKFTPPDYSIIGYDQTGCAVRLPDADRERHTGVTGGSGSGKSQIIRRQVNDSIERRETTVVADLHGQLVDDLIADFAMRPAYDRERLILIELFGSLRTPDPSHTFGFSPIPIHPPPSPETYDTLTCDLLISILKASGEGKSMDDMPRFCRWAYNMLFVAIVNGLSLPELTPFLDPAASRERAYLLERGNIRSLDPLVFADWQEYEKLNESNKLVQTESVRNRFRRYIQNPSFRQVFGHPNPLDVAHLLDTGAVILLNLNARDKAVSEISRLVGILFINLIFRLIKQRDYRDPHLRRVHLVIDEAPVFLGGDSADIEAILSQSRKFGMRCTLALQYLGQVEHDNPQLLAAILGNCANKFILGNLAWRDAESLMYEMAAAHANLNQVKYYEEHTRLRPHEEVRRIVAESRSESLQESRTSGRSNGTGNAIATREARQLGSGTTGAEDRPELLPTRSESSQAGASESRTEGKTSSHAVTITHTPFVVSEEVKEYRPVLYSLPEQMFRLTSAVMRLKMAEEALLSINHREPVLVRVARNHRWQQDASLDALLSGLMEDMEVYQSEYYRPVAEVTAHLQIRQAEIATASARPESPPVPVPRAKKPAPKLQPVATPKKNPPQESLFTVIEEGE